jgi:hypothetical protein
MAARAEGRDPGYSQTPLPKKLGVKEGFAIALPGMPADVRRELREALRTCNKRRDQPLDLILLFSKSSATLHVDFANWASRLKPAGMLWVAWPKKSSGVPTDLDENTIRSIGLSAGLVDVKVCAITDTWSGLKFVYRLKDRHGRY